jgi:DNA-binding beta-propeller fold protein YncE
MILRYAVNTPAAGVDRVLPPGARVDEFLLPVAEDLPHDVAVLDDGRVLVTGMFAHQIWVLDPTPNQWDTEAIPVASANPRAIDLTPRSGIEARSTGGSCSAVPTDSPGEMASPANGPAASSASTATASCPMRTGASGSTATSPETRGSSGMSIHPRAMS